MASQDPMSAIFFVDINLGGPSGPPVPAIVDLGAGAFLFCFLFLF
jgi:hypothetical protein